MKKEEKVRKLLPILLVSAMLLTACSSGTGDISGSAAQPDTDQPSYEELQTQLEAVTEERDSLQTELDALKAQIEAEKAETVLSERDVTVIVTGKSVTPMDTNNWVFYNYVDFVFSITNNTEKDIQGIQGTLTVSDLFGVEIITISCDFTGNTIPAGETIVVDDLTYECNDFDDADMKLFNENYEDLKFAYTVTQIVFTDGTIKNERIKS